VLFRLLHQALKAIRPVFGRLKAVTDCAPRVRCPYVAIKLIVALCVVFACLAPATASAAPASGVRDVLVVGNNWDGTADIVDPYTFQKLAHLNIVPDQAEREAEIQADPAKSGYYIAIRMLIGEGNNQFVDDAFTSHDGRFLYVSRPSFADVVAFDLGTKKIVWRFKVDGYRSDHMAISPDGKRLLVSASTARKVHVIDTATGKSAGEFASGDSPHENNFSKDGKLIYHASIGMVYTPLDNYAADPSKGDRWFEVVDAESLKVLKKVDIGKAMDAAGYPGFSSAVRPMALSPDERFAYFQLSFFHGFAEFDLQTMQPTRIAMLPVSEKAKRLQKEEYLLDSAHHGIAMNPEGTKLCVAGTMSDYAAMVARDSFKWKIAAHGTKPYWVTNSGDGRYCFISFSGDDRVGVISYAEEREIASVAVGDHPQRMRMGVMRSDYLPVDDQPPTLSNAAVVRSGRRAALAFELSEPVQLRIGLAAQRSGGQAGRARVITRYAPAGASRLDLPRLRRGVRYRVTVTAIDGAGNRSRAAVLHARG
jgi:DNA-binding beta-propeller fold protein YncE